VVEDSNVSLEFLRAQLAQARRAPLHSSGGGGTSDGMEARVAVLETHVQHIRDDLTEIRKDLRELRSESDRNFKMLLTMDEKNFRLLFGALIAVALGLAGLMAKGFHWF
jgi:hypothetical protein